MPIWNKKDGPDDRSVFFILVKCEMRLQKTDIESEVKMKIKYFGLK